MSKKWIIIIISLIVLGVLIYLNEKGIIRWQALTIIAAALLGPFKLITSLFKSEKEAIDDINAHHAAVRARENKYQQDVAGKLKERDQQIDQLNKNLQTLNDKMKTLEEEKKTISEEVKEMTVEQKEKEGRDLL